MDGSGVLRGGSPFGGFRGTLFGEQVIPCALFPQAAAGGMSRIPEELLRRLCYIELQIQLTTKYLMHDNSQRFYNQDKKYLCSIPYLHSLPFYEEHN